MKRIAVSLTLATLAFAGCAERPMHGAFRSPQELVEAALEAVASQDGEALRGMLVSRQEYESLLWPSMPDEAYTPFSFFWGMKEANTRKGLRQLENRYGGVELELLSISFFNEPESYDGFSLHDDVDVMVRRSDTGDLGSMPSFDGFLEYRGWWKLLNFDEL